jgi:hypothetical protein
MWEWVEQMRRRGRELMGDFGLRAESSGFWGRCAGWDGYMVRRGCTLKVRVISGMVDCFWMGQCWCMWKQVERRRVRKEVEI